VLRQDSIRREIEGISSWTRIAAPPDGQNHRFEYVDIWVKLEPVPWLVESLEIGKVVELPLVGGLHHLYARRAA